MSKQYEIWLVPNGRMCDFDAGYTGQNWPNACKNWGNYDTLEDARELMRELTEELFWRDYGRRDRIVEVAETFANGWLLATEYEAALDELVRDHGFSRAQLLADVRDSFPNPEGSDGKFAKLSEEELDEMLLKFAEECADEAEARFVKPCDFIDWGDLQYVRIREMDIDDETGSATFVKVV